MMSRHVSRTFHRLLPFLQLLSWCAGIKELMRLEMLTSADYETH